MSDRVCLSQFFLSHPKDLDNILLSGPHPFGTPLMSTPVLTVSGDPFLLSNAMVMVSSRADFSSYTELECGDLLQRTNGRGHRLKCPCLLPTIPFFKNLI